MVNGTALWLDEIVGLLGLFGLGEIYLGKWIRGTGFSLMSVGHYACILDPITYQGLGFVWGYIPAIWGLGYCLPLLEVFLATTKGGGGFEH